jgi:hypothetical protein
VNDSLEAADSEEGSEEGSGADREAGKPGPLDPLAQMARLDALIAAETDESRIRAGLGIRLALALAQEMKAGKPIGSETAALVTAWVHDYGQETVDAAVKVAREFLTKPEELRKTLGQRLGLDGQA